MQLLERSSVFFPLLIRLQREDTSVQAWLMNRARHHRRRRNTGAIGNCQVPKNIRCATNRAVTPQACTTSNTNIACNDSVRAYVHIVCDLNEIIDLHTVFNDGVIQCPPVNTGVSTNLYIIANANSTKLLDFDPASSIIGKTESVGTNNNAGVQQATLTDLTPICNGHARTQHSTATYTSTCTYHTERPYIGTFRHTRSRINHSCRMNTQRLSPLLLLTPKLRQTCEIDIRVRSHNACAAHCCRFTHCRRNNDTSRL